MNKTCTKCGVEKELTAFSPRRGSTEVRNSWCKACCNEYQKARQKRLAMELDEDAVFGGWLKSHRQSIGLDPRQAERLARFPLHRLTEIESGNGVGIKRKEVVALSVLYKLDRGLIEKRAIGA